MIQLILMLALVGFLVWAITTYIPMADVIKKAIYIIVGICVIFYVLQAFGVLGHDLPVPQLNSR